MDSFTLLTLEPAFLSQDSLSEDESLDAKPLLIPNTPRSESDFSLGEENELPVDEEVRSGDGHIPYTQIPKCIMLSIVSHYHYVYQLRVTHVPEQRVRLSIPLTGGDSLSTFFAWDTRRILFS
ncbi:hypothetical protein K435DRAFT_971408 [Dendrothele bispora CBS 962.96]|uniref:Uncharacterized protein n=1 Tax=Dendrothele bispora (strain CBS 962.96) TaxID=1314807 RepID=A0A4V4HCQ8_DENBC|nr:hypothetical protein K435DRAFT_971408 [Dendrothele bispora CBS 962.96]